MVCETGQLRDLTMIEICMVYITQMQATSVCYELAHFIDNIIGIQYALVQS